MLARLLHGAALSVALLDPVHLLDLRNLNHQNRRLFPFVGKDETFTALERDFRAQMFERALECMPRPRASTFGIRCGVSTFGYPSEKRTDENARLRSEIDDMVGLV